MQQRIIQALPWSTILTIVGIAVFTLSASGQPIPLDSLQQIPVQPGDICIVCNMPLGDMDYVFLYKGRRVPVQHEKAAEFLAEPEKYFAQLQARGALFNEGAMPEQTSSYGWFLFGVWAALSLITAGLSAHQAVRKGYPAATWFFTGLALNTVGFILILMKKPADVVALPPGLAKVRTTSDPLKCPHCGYYNHPTAGTCSHCGQNLTPAMESETARTHTIHPPKQNGGSSRA